MHVSPSGECSGRVKAARLTATFGLLLLAADRDHGLRPDDLLLLLVQLWTGIVYEDGHDDGLWELFLEQNFIKKGGK
jgi:hypothetical protein